MTKKDCYPLLQINMLSGDQYFSTLDCLLEMGLRQYDKEKTMYKPKVASSSYLEDIIVTDICFRDI